MLQIIPKWKVIVTLPDREVVLWIHDPFLSNALRKVADMEFDGNSLVQPVQIVVTGKA